jgi:magnesium transporter
LEAEVYLYDARGADKKLDLNDVEPAKIQENHLLWIDVPDRDEKLIQKVIDILELQNVPLKSILDVSERPKIDVFEKFFRFFIVSVNVAGDKKIEQMPIDFLVGENFIISIHKGEVDYFKEFHERENGETQIGELDAESFVSTLLDLHIVSYFRALEEIEEKVDGLDEKVLKTDMEDREFLSEMVKLRRSVSDLRSWFLPHRDVFYALARPDFMQIAQSDSAENFKMLIQHFESAVDSIETSRDTVLSVFDLYTTKSAQKMNIFIQRLTFLTLIVGSMSVIAGVLGMNYKVDFFDSANGFWITIGGMLLIAISLTIVAKIKRWI